MYHRVLPVYCNMNQMETRNFNGMHIINFRFSIAFEQIATGIVAFYMLKKIK